LFDADPSDGVDEGKDDPAGSSYDLLWKYTTASNKIECFPLIQGDRVYFMSNDAYLYCLDADPSDGTDEGISDGSPVDAYDLIWKYNTGVTVLVSSPAILNGLLYVPVGTWLLCINATTGSFVWEKQLSLTAAIKSPIVMTDGTMYINNANRLSCLDLLTEGTFLWNFTFPQTVILDPAVGPEGGLYLGYLKALFSFGTNVAPLKPSAPLGPSEWPIGMPCTFNATSTDGDGDQLSYGWDWGDGSPIQWTGYYESGAVVDAIHIWGTLDRSRSR